MYSLEDSFNDLHPRFGPLKLLHIDVTFRNFAESTPSLWSTITIFPAQIIDTNVPVLRRWLVRSGTGPLNVCVFSNAESNRSILVALLAELIHVHRRWQHLGLFIPPDLLPMMLSNDNAPLPPLSGLMVIMEYEPNFIDLPEAFLQDASLFAYTPPMVHPHGGFLNIRWEQITNFHIQNVIGTIDVIWNMFIHCTQLLVFSIAGQIIPAGRKIPPYGTLILHPIRHLTLSLDAHPTDIGYFLDAMHLPCLQELQLHFPGTADEMGLWPRAAIINLRERSLPPLVRVTISGKPISEEDLIYFVLQMKYLEQLQVSYLREDLVTPFVRNLLPQDEAAVLKREAAFCEELREKWFLM
jgi:hypothetical protein